jgi:hypothetical protein
MKTKVGSPGDDPERTRRFAIAIPSAILITAIFVLASRYQPADRTVAEQIPTAMVVLEHAPPTPRPTPKPTPPPTPVPVVHVTLAPVQRVAPIVAPHVRPAGGAHAAPRIIAHAVHPKALAAPNAGGGNGNDAAAGTGAGTGSGNASGNGDADAGDAVNADAPCGSVDLIPFEAPDRSGGSIFEHIQATVTFPDGHTQVAEFPYRFAYADLDSDPWSARNMRNPSFVVRVQPAPVGANTSRYPDVIRYILDHTRQNGLTVLQECPRLR